MAIVSVDADTLMVEITRGDTAIIDVTLEGDVPADGTIALISLKKQTRDTTAVWEKRVPITNGQFTFSLTSADTDLAPWKYWWDVRFLYKDGSVYTPMSPSPFVITEVIGNA